jgi:hypothetical protein
MPSKKPTRVAKAARVTTPLRMTGKMVGKGTLAVAACVIAGGMLVAARPQSPPVLTTTPRLDAVPMPVPPAKNVTASNARTAVAGPEPASSAKTATATATATATVSGCLERDGDSFRLKDVSGADAPKARSWKSGFLKKGPAAIEVVDGGRALKLSDQVGRRVSVTGVLAGRELTAQSLRRVAATCSTN